MAGEAPVGFKEVRLATSSAAAGDLVTREYTHCVHLHGGACWAAGQAAALTLDRSFASAVAGKTVVELGSGCGPAGLMCAKLGARRVFLTDRHKCLLPGLRETAAANGLADGVVETCYLSFSGALPPEIDGDDGDVDVVVAVDQAYTTAAASALVDALTNLARKTPTLKVLLFVEVRPSTPACLAVIEAREWMMRHTADAHGDDLAAAALALSEAGALGALAPPPASLAVYELTPPHTLFVAHDNDKHARPLRADSFINSKKKPQKLPHARLTPAHPAAAAAAAAAA